MLCNFCELATVIDATPIDLTVKIAPNSRWLGFCLYLLGFQFESEPAVNRAAAVWEP